MIACAPRARLCKALGRAARSLAGPIYRQRSLGCAVVVLWFLVPLLAAAD